jgi:hypothetical protein
MADPAQVLRALLQPGAAGTLRFPPNSRYHGVPVATLTTPDGRVIAFLERRLVPPPERFESIEEYRVVEGDRLDLVAARFAGDPEQFWRLCDANGALRPDELEVVGRRIRITLPEGLQGPPRA